MSTEQALLLRAAVLEHRAGEDAYRAWREAVALDDVDHRSHLVLPLLQHGSAARGSDGRDGARLLGLRRRAWYRSTVLVGRAAPALAALHGRGIGTAVVGGALLAAEVYPQPDCRPIDAVEVLVAPSSVPLALSSLTAAGWEHDADPMRVLPPVRLTDGRGGALVLRGGLSRWRRGHRWDELAWARRRPFRLGATPTTRLDPADELLLAMVDGQRAGAMTAAVWIADAALLLRAGGVDGARFAEAARSAGAVPAARRGVRVLDELFGAAVPAPSGPGLGGARVALADRALWAHERVAPRYRLDSLARYVDQTTADGRPPTPLGYLRQVRGDLRGRGEPLPRVVRRRLSALRAP